MNWAALFEPSVGMADDADFPLAWLTRIPAAILFDRDSGRCVLMAESGQHALVEAMAHDLAQARARHSGFAEHCWPCMKTTPLPFWRASRVSRNTSVRATCSRSICRAAGRPISRIRLLLHRCFARLMQKNPAPFSALVQMEDWAIVSSSPERLVRLGRDGMLETRPIAGTHPRSEDAAEDAALRARLQAHPKERAEHVMLVDLERNDLGRVCEPGSVKVAALMDIASYRHVHHIESTVCGQAASGHERVRCLARRVSRRHHHRLPQGAHHADHS